MKISVTAIEFQETTNQLLEFISTEEFARRYGLMEQTIIDWSVGKNLPGDIWVRKSLMSLIQRDPIWDEFF